MFITRALIAGGGAPEIEVSIRLAEYARTLTGMEAYCVRAFAEALEIIPYTLAENAGLNPIATVTELRNRHAKNETTTGINVRKVGWFNNLQDACELHHHYFLLLLPINVAYHYCIMLMLMLYCDCLV